MTFHNAMDDVPVDGIVVMHGNIAKSHSSDAATRAFAQLLPDPCHPPFCQHPIAIGREVCLFKQMLAKQTPIGTVTTQQTPTVPKNLTQQGFGHAVQVDQINRAPRALCQVRQ